jgi:two-component system sensor histidine kinase HydH
MRPSTARDVSAAPAGPAPSPLTLSSQQRLELDRVLDAWNVATNRLQKTHESLREEVHRLTNELEAKNRELARKNRLADLGHMASHVAHEVRNGLAPVTLYLSLLRRRLQGDVASLRIMDNIEAGIASLGSTVSDLLSFTQDRDPIWRDIELHELVTEVCNSLAPQLAAQGIETCVQVPLGMHVQADRDMVRRALLNLVFNALDAMPAGGELVVTACRGEGGWELEVADTGPGIETSVLNRVFEPFFTTKPEGTGLGLAIVYRIAEAHQGDVRAVNCPEGGAAFILRIPDRVVEAAA